MIKLEPFSAKNFCRHFLSDTKGAFAVPWAIAMTGLMVSIGATYDLAQLSKAKTLAQIAADNMALTASIAVDMDNDDKYTENQSYPYSAISGGAVDFTNSITGKVEYDVVDNLDPNNAHLDETDKARLLARVTISGTYKTNFMGIVGIQDVEFGATADAAYAARQGTPASIFFVTDNSGSMNSYDSNSVRKISSLVTSMTGFMDVLDDIPIQGNTIFRTALYPYSSSLLQYRVVAPDWGTLSSSEINQMYAGGGTRSTSALTRAKTKFNLENSIHKNANGEDTPLKFLIFMSDGANNGATTQQQCSVEDIWVPATREFWWKRKRNGSIQHKYNRPRRIRGWTYVPAVQGHYEQQNQCHYVPYSPENVSSLAQCTAMKAAGVKIYAIAYDVHYTERAMAEEFMKTCSSGVEDYYHYATSGADLQAVFDKIGESVVREVIRLKR